MSLLPLPIAPRDALNLIIVPTYKGLPARMNSPRVRLLSLATAIQETNLATRVQDDGPARGLWQAQIDLVKDLRRNPTTRDVLRDWCTANRLPVGKNGIFNALALNDALACVVHRLEVWCDPHVLPGIGDTAAAWAAYLRTQRPGKPDWLRWSTHSYPEAMAAFSA